MKEIRHIDEAGQLLFIQHCLEPGTELPKKLNTSHIIQTLKITDREKPTPSIELETRFL